MAKLRVKEGKLSIFLLMVMLLSIVWSMEMAGWVEGLYAVEWTTLGGLIVGFLLIRSRWPRVVSHLVGLVVGALLVVATMARFIGAGLGWRDGLYVLTYQFDVWLRTVVAGQSSTDPVMFVLLVTLLGWWLGYASAWMTFGTHRVWQTLALTGGAMLLVVYGSSPKVVPFFVLYVLCALLLAVRMYVYAQEQSWEKGKAHFDQDIGFYFLRDGGLLVAAVIAAIWIFPLLSSSSALSDLWAQVGGPWRTVGNEWNRLFSGIRGYGQDYENIPFAERLALGGPVELGENVVMWVTTEKGRYWRGTTYDKYDGRGWQNTDGVSAAIPAETDLPREGRYELRRLVRQTIVPTWSGIGQMFWVGQPVRVDLPVEIEYSFTYPAVADTRDPFSAPAMVSLIKSRVPLAPDRPYTVVSSASVADVESLRGDGDDYPTWATQRYLQLPPTLPERVIGLAEEIAGPYDNAYDKATAVRDYLRRAIAYNEDIEAPPPDRDPIDYLLFDSQEGYCTYYASAMVVLARAVGIPSRLAVGYAGGDVDSELGRYQVRESNTHAWVEVYFPGYGWVEFEPTASEEPIFRAGRIDEIEAARESSAVESQQERELERFAEDVGDDGVAPPPPSSGRPLAGVLVLMGIGVAASTGIAYWIIRSRRLEELSGAGKVYWRMCSYARFLGEGGEFHQTPFEYASVLAERVPPGTHQIERITALYVRERFAPHAADSRGEQEAEEAWQKLRPLLTQALLRKVRRSIRGSLRWRP